MTLWVLASTRLDSLMNSIGSRVVRMDDRHVLDMYDMANANGRNYEEDE